MKTFTMVARHGLSKDKITGFTLIAPNYQTIKVSTDELKSALTSNKIKVTNLTLDEKGAWKSTNGALDSYTFISDTSNSVEGVPKAVILDRVEQNNKLLGYTVFTQTGTIVEMSVADAVMLTTNKLISNGKIRHTEKGDIVSAIGGNYPLRELKKIEDAPKGETSVDLVFFSTVVKPAGEKVKSYFGAIVACTSATEMTKLIDKLSKSNAAVVGSIVHVGGQQVRKTLGIKRVGANSLYGVFEISALRDMVKSGAKVKNSVGQIPVAALTYDSDGKAADEAVVTVDKSWRVIDNEDCESDVVNKVAKNFANKIIEGFKSVEIQGK